MVQFEQFELANGLRVIVHEDATTPMAAVNMLYNVGARDEDPDQTGLAHLFEHLMFEGSANAPDFDNVLQMAGGVNNAFTSNDLTNYYNILPANNLETAFWLESDRMMNLALDAHKVDVQKKVVIEEFKESHLNQPYGDVLHLLSNLAFKVHPYQWPTIGKKMSHIEQVDEKIARDFFNTFYRPNNCILAVGGNVKADNVKKRAEYWFGDIPAGEVPGKNFPKEPPQEAPRQLDQHAEVPLSALFKAYHMDDRLSQGFYKADLLSDILSNGYSSRLYQRLIKENPLFTDINAQITGTLDEGLFIVEGHLNEGVSIAQGEQAITNELEKIQQEGVSEDELQKVRNKLESSLAMEEVNLLNKVFGLAYFELLGDAAMYNKEFANYNQFEPEDLREKAKKLFDPNNCSTLHYYAKKGEDVTTHV